MSSKLSRAMLGALYKFVQLDQIPAFWFHDSTRRALVRRGLITGDGALYSLTDQGRQKVNKLWGDITFIEHPPVTLKKYEDRHRQPD